MTDTRHGSSSTPKPPCPTCKSPDILRRHDGVESALIFVVLLLISVLVFAP